MKSLRTILMLPLFSIFWSEKFAVQNLQLDLIPIGAAVLQIRKNSTVSASSSLGLGSPREPSGCFPCGLSGFALHENQESMKQ